MTLKLANNATSRLSSSVGSSDLTITVLAGEGAKFPSLLAGEWFPVTIVKANGTLEIMKCTGRSGDTLTVERAQEDTTAKAFDSGDRVELRLTKRVIDDLYADFAELSGDLTEQAAGKLDSTGGVATNLSLHGSLTEEVHALTGASPAIDPANGTIQTWTLTAESSPTANLASGQSVLLEVNGAGFGVTWPTIQWKTGEGNPPELATGVVVPIVLWKVGASLRGARVGDA